MTNLAQTFELQNVLRRNGMGEGAAVVSTLLVFSWRCLRRGRRNHYFSSLISEVLRVSVIEGQV